MISLEQYEEVLDMSLKTVEDYPRWRWGQVVFNTLHKMYPNTANFIRGTKLDMYHINENVNKFKTYIKENYENYEN